MVSPDDMKIFDQRSSDNEEADDYTDSNSMTNIRLLRESIKTPTKKTRFKNSIYKKITSPDKNCSSKYSSN